MRERQRQLQEKYQRLKQDREHKQQQQQQNQKQRRKKHIRDNDDDDDDTIMTKLTQKSSLECKELECNLIDEEDDKYDGNIVIIPTQVLFRMKPNVKWKSKRKRKQQEQKEKYSRKVKMKKKIANMISNVTNGYPTSDDDVSREHETKGILKMIDRRKLTKK